MTPQELEKRKGCNKNVLVFFIIAIACVVAFLIVGLVRTCDSDHSKDGAGKTQTEKTDTLTQNNPQ